MWHSRGALIIQSRLGALLASSARACLRLSSQHRHQAHSTPSGTQSSITRFPPASFKSTWCAHCRAKIQWGHWVRLRTWLHAHTVPLRHMGHACMSSLVYRRGPAHIIVLSHKVTLLVIHIEAYSTGGQTHAKYTEHEDVQACMTLLAHSVSAVHIFFTPPNPPRLTAVGQSVIWCASYQF